MKNLRLLYLLTCAGGIFATSGLLHAQENVSEVLSDRSIDWKNPAQRAQAVQRMKAIENRQLEKARQIARQKGKPLREEQPGGKVRELVGLDVDGELLYVETRNANAAISSAANLIHPMPYNLDGSDVVVGVWDGGAVRVTHQEFDSGSGSRVTVRDGYTTLSSHATHVAGTVAASGVVSSAKGMAPNVLVDSYHWTSDDSEMIAAGATGPGQASKVSISNHSYGFARGWDGNRWRGTGTDQNAYASQFGQYTSKARSWDSISYNAPYYLIFHSAGNDNSDNPSNGSQVYLSGSATTTVTYDRTIHPPGDGLYRNTTTNSANGYENIGDQANSKNIMVVGAANDAVTSGLRDPSKSTLTSFSSRGPTDDGRIKPDIVANGAGLYSTESSGNTAYSNKSGTSMSSPSAAGSAALLVHQYRNLFPGDDMLASTLKGLILHTATDIGNPGPDYHFGWGLIDVKTAADLLTNTATYPDMLSLVEDQVSTSTSLRTYNFFWDGESAIRATLCWTDPAASSTSTHDSRTSRLVNDLNLKLIAPDGTEYFPFVMPYVGTWTVESMSAHATTGVNNTDNVEQVLIENPVQTGEWTIEISYAGSLTNNAQDYGLIVSGSSFNPGGTVAFGSDNFPVNEDAGPATITVDRIGGNQGAISVDYATSNGTAVAGSDYTATSGTLIWADGDSTSKTITIPITNDSVHEDPQETLYITLSNPSGALISGTNPATLTIFEDDNQLPVVVAGDNQLVYLSGTAWSPDTLSPALWLDADDGTSITLNGSTVSQWNDQTINGRNATQSISVNQPTYTVGGLNGRNVLTFDGSSDFLNVNLDFMAGVDHSVFVVAKTTTYSNIYGAANGGASANSLHVGFRDAASYRMNYWGNDWYGTISSNFLAGAANVLNYVWKTGTSKEIFTNGKSEGSSTNAGIIGTMSGGGRISNVTGHGYYGGDIGEFIAFTGALSPEDRQALEGFLAHKWGTTSLLAADHPYKTQGPDNYAATATLGGSVSDPDSDPFSVTWSLFDGPAAVTFADPNALDTTVTFRASGTYTLRLAADDGYDTAYADVVITVLEEGTATYTVGFQTDGTAGASLTGETSQTVAENGSTTEVIANAPTGYRFLNWTWGGVFYSVDNPLTVTSVTANMTLTANFAKTASIAIADDGSITELSEDGEAIIVTLTDGVFATTLTPANWSLSGQPGGVTRGDVTRISDTAVRILLSGNSTTDYDSNITTMQVTCAAAEVVNAVSPLSANTGVTFTAINDPESIEISDDGWILEGAEDGELITVILNGGTFSPSLDGANWTVSNLPAGVSKGTVTRVNANVATIRLNGNRTVSYSGSDITNVEVTCTTSEYTDSTGGTSLSDSTGVTLRALNSGSSSVVFQDGLNSYTGVTDTYIYDGSPSSNYGTATTVRLNNRVGGGPNETLLRGLLRFDLSSIPTDATINSVEIDFVQDNTIAGSVDIVEATASWTETGATWDNSNSIYGGTVFGSSTTGSLAGEPVPTITLNSSGISKVQSWVADPASNHGFGITTTYAENGEASSMALRSSDYGTSSSRPKLTITYETTGGGGDLAPEINLQGNGISIVSGDTTPASADHTDFGATFTGGSTVVRTFTIQNLGDAELTLSGSPRVEITGSDAGDFVVTSLPTLPGSPVAAGGSTTFEITFAPTAAGTRSATVSIANNDLNENPYTFAIEGEGVIPPVTYAVIYDGNGSTGGAVPDDSLSPYDEGATVIVLGNTGGLVRTGYSFNNWNTAADGSGTPYAPADSFAINAATTLYAQWTALDYTVTYDGNGSDSGTAPVDPASPYSYSETVTVLGSGALTRVGFTFSHWDTVPDGSGTDYTEGNTFAMPDANVVLYAQWTPSVHTVTFDKQGGTGGDDSVTATFGEPMPTATAPSRVGYAFGGYFTGTDGTGTLYYDSAMASGSNWDIDAASTLYAHWILVPVSIVTDQDSVSIPEGGTGTFDVKLSDQPTGDVVVTISADIGDADITVQSGAVLTFTTTTWDTYQTVTLAAANDADDLAGSRVIYCDGDNPNYTDKEITASEIDKHTTLTVSSGGNGSTTPSGDLIVEKGAATAISATPSIGYDFVSWDVPGGSAVIGDANLESTTASIDAPATIRANFALETYTVTYNGNDNTGGEAPADQTKTYGVDLTLAGNTGALVKAGYSFSGWNTAADGSGTNYNADGTYSLNEPLTLYAKWIEGSDGNWTGISGAWSDTTSPGGVWLDGVYAQGADATAHFTGVNITANQTITLDDLGRTLGHIVFTDETSSSNNLTISGANALTLAVSTGFPTINVTQSVRTLAITAPIAGANGLQKDGPGILDLRNSSSSYSGHTVLNGGQITINADANLGDTSGDIIFSGNATLRTEGTVTLSEGRTITINEGVTATLTSTNDGDTFPGVLEGSGSLNANHTTSFIFSNSANTFTGAIRTATGNAFTYGLMFASLPDEPGCGDISLDEGSFFWTGSGGTKIFDDRQFILSGGTGRDGLISNRSTDASLLVIEKDLGVTSTGSKILTLAGTSNGVFAGNIGDGSSVVGLTKMESSTWALGGTNTYTGTTTLNQSNPATGGITFQGMQALSPDTNLYQIHGGGTGGHGTWKFLDDAANPASRSTVNVLHNQKNASQNAISMFVGNNSAVNGGTSSSTQTGSTIQLGNLTFRQDVTGATGGARLNLTGADDYGLQLAGVNIELNSAYTGIWNVRLDAISAPLTVTGNVQQVAGSLGTTNLQLDGDISGNLISGNILDSADGTPQTLAVTKEGISTWTLSGNNGYTGTTIISAGKLFINGDQSAATGNVSVAAGATLGGSGTLGGSTTIDANGKIEFNISTGTAGHDPLNVASGKDFTFSGASVLTITSSGGATTGSYTLITGGNNIVGSAPATVNLPANWIATVSISGNSLLLDVTSVGDTTYSVTYNGNDNDGGTVPVDGASYSPDASVTVLGNTGGLTKDGYNFAGWNTSANGSGTSYAPDDTFNISDDTTLYAQWSLKPALTITAASAVKSYDGAALTDSGYSLTNGTLEPGHTLASVTVTGSQTAAGSSDNVPSAALIEDGGPTDVTAYYDITYENGTLTVNKATPTATLEISNTPVTYDGTAQSAVVAIQSSSVEGAVANVSNGTHTAVGTYAVTADFVPTDTANYETLTGLVAGDFVIGKATPVVTEWPTATSIVLGEALSASTLSGGAASVAGSFAFTTPGITPESVGTYNAPVTFTPSDTDNYIAVEGSTNVEVLSSGDYANYADYAAESGGSTTDPSADDNNNGIQDGVEYAFYGSLGQGVKLESAADLAQVLFGALEDTGTPDADVSNDRIKYSVLLPETPPADVIYRIYASSVAPGDSGKTPLATCSNGEWALESGVGMETGPGSEDVIVDSESPSSSSRRFVWIELEITSL